MAITKKIENTNQGGVKRKTPKKKSDLDNTGTKTSFKKTDYKPLDQLEKEIELPHEKTRASKVMGDYTFLIYGARNIGKTSLCSMFPDAFMFCFEAGIKSLEVYGASIPDWGHAMIYKKKVLESGDYTNIILDTARIAYDRCLEYVCAYENCVHPSDQDDYGGTWSKVKIAFEGFHSHITTSGLGLVAVAHERLTDLRTATGLKYSLIEPDLGNGAMKYYSGAIDTTAYYRFFGSERFLTIRGNDTLRAGTRCKYNFWTPKGERVVHIPLGNNEEEAYINLVNAFNNKQVKSYSNLK